MEFVAPRFADLGPGFDRAAALAVPITNGLGAGLTHSHALAHGILELLQRDGNSVHYRALDRGCSSISATGFEQVRDPRTRSLLQTLDAAGIEILVKLADDSFGLPNLYVVGYDRDPAQAPQAISLSACGEAVHPDRERALAKALREFVSARARKAFNHGPLAPVRAVAPPGYLEAFGPASLRSEDDRALTGMQRWMRLDHAAYFEEIRHPLFDVRARLRFDELPTTDGADSGALLALLTERLAQAGLEIYYVDFTPPGSPVVALKAIVPGLEVETMTYQRIGARNLRRLLSRGSPLVGVGRPPTSGGALPIRLTPAAAATFDGEPWFDPAALSEPSARSIPCTANRAATWSPSSKNKPAPTPDFSSRAHLLFFPPLLSRHFRDERLRAKPPAGTRRARPRGHDDLPIPWRRGGHARLRRRAAAARARRAGDRTRSLGRTGATDRQLRADIETMVQTAVAEHARRPSTCSTRSTVTRPAWPRWKRPNVSGCPTSCPSRAGTVIGSASTAARRTAKRCGWCWTTRARCSSAHAALPRRSTRTTARRPSAWTIVPGAVDATRFRPREDWQAGEWIDPAQPTILYHGRVDRRKGALDLLDAFATLRRRGHPLAQRTRLLYSGIGPDSAAVAERAQTLGLERCFYEPGLRRLRDVPAVYRRADLFASPTYSEGFSNTILEAMSAGLPIVSCHAVGVVDCLRDGENGLLVQPGDIHSLADAWAACSTTPPLRRRLAECAFEEVHRLYSWPVVARQIAGVYAQVRATAPDNGWTLRAPLDPACRYRAAPHLL